MDTVLSINEISKRYGRIQAVSSMSLNVSKGQVYGLLGPNGSGKTTTLGIILGLIRPDSGSYQWFGGKPGAKSRRRIGALIDQPNFYPWLSGLNNLKITAAIRGVPAGSIQTAMEMAGIHDRCRDTFASYSLGMKQRLAVASTLVGDPDVLVLDEPTNGVDAKGIADIRNIILELAQRGKTVILASHILDEVEKTCDSVAVLKSGEMIESGNIAHVLNPGDIIEMAAENMEKLAEKIKDHPGILGMNPNAGHLNVRVEPGMKTGDMNQFLFDHGITLTHLVRRKRSLESRFLELLEDDNQ